MNLYKYIYTLRVCVCGTAWTSSCSRNLSELQRKVMGRDQQRMATSYCCLDLRHSNCFGPCDKTQLVSPHRTALFACVTHLRCSVPCPAGSWCQPLSGEIAEDDFAGRAPSTRSTLAACIGSRWDELIGHGAPWQPQLCELHKAMDEPLPDGCEHVRLAFPKRDFC